MANLSANLSVIIQKSAINAILSYDFIEDEIIDHLYGGLVLLDMAPSGKFDPKRLRQFQAAYPRLDYLEIYNAQGTFLYPRDSIPILRNLKELQFEENDNSHIGFYQHPHHKVQLLGVVRKDNQGNILAAYTDAAHLLALRKTIGVGSLLNSLAKDTSIAYIAIQDSLGIIAATRLIDTLNSINGDDFIEQVLQMQRFAWRITKFHNEPVFEGVLPFNIAEASYGVIRIGLNYQPIAQIQQAAIRQLILRLGLLAVLGFIILVYVIAIQNVRLLETEKEKITNEVIRLQADLQQKEKLSAMGELAAGVAHEIRNPLNAISMLVQILERDRQNNAEWQQQLATMRKEITRIQDIIQQFLTFARPAPLRRSFVDIGAIITKVVQTYQARAVSQNVAIAWQSHNVIKANIDPEKITTCLSNLLDNALDATTAGGHITINLQRKRRVTSITIADDGVGIPPEHLDKIFNLYFTTKPNGTGLGLAQAYQIISEHNGTIEVASQPGAGTNFKITIPD